MVKIFIDGEAGTTGLQIRDRLKDIKDIEMIHLKGDQRKDISAREEMLNIADLVILCLPEDASKEAVGLIHNSRTKIIDASIAYRVNPDWVYGFPEYNLGQSAIIEKAKRVSNPGCYACASIAIIHPLVSSGLLPEDYPITINAVSGYSGGGTSLIKSFEATNPETASNKVPFYLYGLDLNHKHIPEIKKYSRLRNTPIFIPSVGRFYSGMLVSVPLQIAALEDGINGKKIYETLSDHYLSQPFVKVVGEQNNQEIGKLMPEDLNNTNFMKIYVFSNQKNGQALICAQLDNLGKGASGQAVQNLKLMLNNV